MSENGRNPKFVFPDTIPDTNWVKEYYKHHTEHNKAPYPEYHFATALAFVQMGVGRAAYININGRRHYSNLNQLLLGATTISRKTDALDPVKHWFQVKWGDKMLPSDFSGAGLLEALELTPDGYIVIDEAGTLFNRLSNNKEAGTIRDILCRVYDNDPDIYKQLTARGRKDGNGAIRIKYGFPTLVLGTTPETFSKYAISLDMTSGFLVRFLMYCPNTPKKSIPLVFGYDREISEKELMDKFAVICETVKKYPFGYRFTPAPDAAEYFNKWKETNEEKYGENQLHGAISNRLMIMALKMTMLFMMGDPAIISPKTNPLAGNGEKEPLNITIPLSYLKPVCELIDAYFMPHAVNVYETIERDASKNVQDKIISKLTAYGGQVEVWRLSKDLHILAEDRDRHLNSLFESREVTMFEKDGTVWCRFWQDGDNEKMAASKEAKQLALEEERERKYRRGLEARQKIERESEVAKS